MTNIEILIAIVGIVKINKIKKKLRSSLFHFIARSKVTHFFINEILYAYLLRIKLDIFLSSYVV